MKTIKFRSELADLILKGEKTTTWRLFDDKDLKVGDELAFLRWEDQNQFAKAVITDVKEKKLSETTEDDYSGHEKYNSTEEMLKIFKGYYGEKVTPETVVKIIQFKLI